MHYAMIENGIVFNVAVWDGVTPWEPGCEVVLIPEDSLAWIGWGWDGEKFVEPVEQD